jgi:hypothetical protein
MKRDGAHGWLSTRQCADFIGVTVHFVRGEIRDGRIRARKLERDGKRPIYRVSADDFNAYVSKHWSRAETSACLERR